ALAQLNQPLNLHKPFRTARVLLNPFPQHGGDVIEHSMGLSFLPFAKQGFGTQNLVDWLDKPLPFGVTSLVERVLDIEQVFSRQIVPLQLPAECDQLIDERRSLESQAQRGTSPQSGVPSLE